VSSRNAQNAERVSWKHRADEVGVNQAAAERGAGDPMAEEVSR
jgi:hypothetical protein